MSLLFGNLTQDFVNFGIATSNFNGTTAAIDNLNDARNKFESAAAKSASELVYIGMYNYSNSNPLSFIEISAVSVCRYRDVGLHIYLHGYMGLYWRNQC